MKRVLGIGLAMAIVTVLAANATAQDTGKGGLRYSVTVTKFDNEAGWSGRWEIGDAFKTIMTAALDGSGKFIVLGDSEMRNAALEEQDLAASGRMAGGKKAPPKGQMTPAQLLVRGSVTHVQDDTTGGGGKFNFKGISLGGAGGKAEVNMTMYLVDSRTGQVKASTKVVGVAGRKGIDVGYSGAGLGGLTGDLDMYKKDNVGKACENAVAQAVEFLTKKLETLPWEGTVAAATESKIFINRGSREGVAPGMKFTVGATEEVTDPDTGEVLDTSVKEAGTIEVTEVKEKVSYCKPLSGKAEKGMGIFPAK